MRWSLNIGRLFGIRLELHVTFLLLVAWVAVGQGLLTGLKLKPAVADVEAASGPAKQWSRVRSSADREPLPVRPVRFQLISHATNIN